MKGPRPKTLSPMTRTPKRVAPPKGAKPIARITAYAIPKKGGKK